MRPGSLLWIPAGAKLSIISSHECRTIYFEARPTTQANGDKDSNVTTFEPLQEKLGLLVTAFIEQNPCSQNAIERARGGLPGGTTRAVLESEPFPLVMRSGKGATLTSIDGKLYLDFVSDFTAGLFGHSHPAIQQAVLQAAENGFSLGAVTEGEAQLSETIKNRFSSIELIRYCNSGTEANTYAIGTALAYTGRQKVLVFDRAYHGGTLSFGSAANELNAPYDFVLGVYDDIEKTRALLSPDIGAILVEPMQSAGGMRMAAKEFFHFLREAANTIGAVLIFDEVVTSRLDFHGLQGKLGIFPDMTTLGKYLGGGLPFGAFGGKREIMALYDHRSGSPKRLSHSGTFNNNIFTISAALAASKIVTKEAIERVNLLGDRVREGLIKIIVEAGRSTEIIPAGVGSCVGIHFRGKNGDVLREVCFFHLLSKGVWIGRRGFLALNFAHRNEDIETFLNEFRDFLAMCR